MTKVPARESPGGPELISRLRDEAANLALFFVGEPEEKMLFALLWNRNLHGFWRQELGEGFFNRLRRLVPYTWLVDPSPLPPHTATGLPRASGGSRASARVPPPPLRGGRPLLLDCHFCSVITRLRAMASDSCGVTAWGHGS